MSIRNLDALFAPSSVALIGAGARPGSVGAVIARNLFRSGFAGPVMPVNRRPQTVEGVEVHPDIASLPQAPDLAVIATPPATVPGVIAELGARGTRGAVVITAGLGAAAPDGGKSLRQQMLDAARPHLMRIVGPNCIGIMVPGIGLNGSFAHIAPRKGDIAFLTQSGAMVTAVLDWATTRGIGFSHFVSLGDMADVDFGDMLDYLAADPDTHAVLLYIEAITNARKFMSAARACARLKPVVVIKAGRHTEGARAAASHTGALAGADAVYDAAFRRAGALRVYQMHELFNAVETLALSRPVAGDRLAILTNGGGPGVLATDALIDSGGRLAELSPQTRAQLDKVLPPTWSRSNPVDIIGDAPGSRFADALQAMLQDKGMDAILVLNCPTAIASSSEAAAAVIDTVKGSRRPVFTSWLGDSAAAESRAMFGAHRIPTFFTPEQAIGGFMYMVRHRRAQELLMEVPPSVPEAFTPDTEAANAVIRRVVAEGRPWLSEAEAKSVIAAYGIPIVETRIVATPEAAAQAAAAFKVPVALKILSRDITHKSDIGGVVLNLEGADAVRAAADSMHRHIGTVRPEARLEGFTVQPMVNRAEAYELIVGMVNDVQFGPVVLFGHGGTGVEVINDKALALPPLNMKLAREMMAQTRIFKLMQGFRGKPAVALDDVALCLIKLAQLVADCPEIEELDINPLLADEHGVVALDARIKVAPAAGDGASRLAIRPYPRALEQELQLRDGTRVPIRPVRPEDGPGMHRLFGKMAPEDIRLRFFTPMKTLPAPLAARLSQIDYDREMALVATESTAHDAEALGAVRIAADPDNERAEYAILVRTDMKGRGLGYALMRRMIDYARERGIGEIFGDVLRENHPMLKLCRDLGFTAAPTEDPTVVRMSLPL
ncbi:bifunctional acetate--CoA ligase family protein/GNAT family N-acetyltransferase [Vineibacter terrae]|uniref:Bifunctional acetate--CoA ligase family protein/GNAT family N-acetyltransferase n=1 Tax=Vineibacter terrae TaxID=2586908 RepID=A0A5C8PT84_9HYPH|nr:bifunctional acetate--CoA ligase family protein/GNAT family N-acetyltransferase [Vineibacter terrae]TXL80289.1 bifunctional acetate--CoA ligase family protein/GNAT family N-acetyltransferase [Vineibacter terrae]